MSPECTVPSAELAEYAVGGLSERRRRRFEAHSASCERCHARLSKMGAMLSVMRAPPDDAGTRDRMVTRALAASPASPARRPIRFSFAFGAAALAALGGMTWVALRPPTDTVLLSGELLVDRRPVRSGEALAVGVEVRAGDAGGAVMKLPNGSRIAAGPATVLVLDERRGTRWHVRRGRLELAIVDERASAGLSIVTDEGTATVVSATFTVQRASIAGASHTRIEVQTGVVEVTAQRDGAHTRLTAGQSLTLGDEPSDAAAAQPRPEPEGAPPHVATAKAHDVVAGTIAAIRGRIEAGELAKARGLLEQAKKRRDLDANSRAELGLVAAETDLAEKRYDLAISGYLATAKSYPRTSQAEAGLFAAAQLAVDHSPEPGAGKRLLEQYLAAYPRGRFAGEARLLLRAVESAP
jgi:hypothetical protein